MTIPPLLSCNRVCLPSGQFMRCFENHQVVAFEDLKNSHEAIPIHKPIFCETHLTETMKFYCVTCQTLICNDCLLVEHKLPEHRYERLQDAHETHRGELSALVAEGRTKLLYCEEASCQLEGALSELQVQHDAARELVQETFHSYKAVIERCRDAALERLKSLHKQRELGIMDTCDSVEKVVEKMNHACKFTSRLLEHGNAPEVLALKKTVGAQLLYLINNTPKCNVNTAIHFDTDMSKFEDAVKATFGSFRTEPVTTPKESSPAPVTPLVLNGAANSSNNNSSANTTGRSSVMTTSSSPVSLSVSMQSSFEGDLAAGVVSQGTALPPMLSPPEAGGVPTGGAPALHGLTSIQEYNLQQLANLAAEKEGVGVVGAEEPSPAPSFTLADLFSGDMSSTSHALNNLQALAKLGNISLNNQGQLVVNGAPAGVDTLGAATLPSQTLGALLSDLAASALNGTSPVNGGEGSIVLGRGASPSLSINTNIASINGGSFPTLSGTPSPMLSPEELLSDGLHTMPPPPSSGLAPPPQSNFHLMRNSSGKITPMQIRCKYGQLGPAKGQFNSPHGFCLGSEEDIIVADTNNHRIQVFEKTGTFKFQFGIPGKEEGQLWYPRKVAVMRNSGKFVVCDRGNERSRMQIFTKNGHFIKKIAIRYIDIVAGLAVTSQGHIVAVDSVSPTVFVISECGDLLRWFDCSDYMREPSDIAISGQYHSVPLSAMNSPDVTVLNSREYYVCDFKGHCVVVFNEDGQFLRRIGCETITNFPNGIDISDAGDVLVGDSHGNRFHVAVFSRDGSMLCEFECPYVKHLAALELVTSEDDVFQVSRCCGLKITSEGYIVTLAKNNHHVLVLNTLYIV
uniref:B box-type domain-containing protein n=1 Tax=Timema poppense TaxID=170557 RepID=A0A7R9CZM5_TIMPO|nr:unnamed protein product [Timema poppensis]